MATSLLLYAALAAAALALRMPSEYHDAEAWTLTQRAVPEIGVFRDLWARRYASEKHLSKPKPSSIQLILGVFTTAPDFEYREIVRNTWMKQKGVCCWRFEPKKGCSVYVAFVIGKTGLGVDLHRAMHPMSDEDVEQTHREKGMLVLDTHENMNEDKSRLWFETARQRFPWASHVGKVDMDTYPFLHKLLRRMDARRSCIKGVNRYEVIGRPHDSSFSPHFGSVCKSDGCQQFVSRPDFMAPVVLPGLPWSFWSGELYILSMPLVQKVDWTEIHYGTEDLQVTKHVGRAAQTQGFCVVLRRLDAWFHKSLDCNATYANEV